jgi:CheY-like chemotaxis protein
MEAHPVTILMAEDDDGHATLVQRNLQRAGLANPVVRVRDGQEALDYVFATGEYVDRPRIGRLLLLLDINMPRVDGIEVLQRVRETESSRNLPVIMLTTTDDPREVRRCYDLGCSVYITKPVEYEPFVEAVKRLGLFLQVVTLPPEQA